MKRLIIDNDGTWCEYKQGSSLDDLLKPGYFANLGTYPHVVEAIKMFKEAHPEIPVIIASKVLNEPHIIPDKNKMVDRELGNYVDERIYIPYSQKKTDFIHVTEDDYLLDDYSENLREWIQAGGHGIKLLNGLNGKHGTWCGPFVHKDYPAWMIKDHIEKEMNLKGEM